MDRRAKEHLKENDEIHMVSYPEAISVFTPGSYVLVKYNNPFRPGPNSKLLPFLKGPFLVLEHNQSKYLLRDLTTMKDKLYHVSRMITFDFDPTKWNPLKIALRDNGNLYAIEKITAMKGNPKGKKSELKFKVSWVGYPDEYTWEPWINIRNTEAVSYTHLTLPTKRIV